MRTIFLQADLTWAQLCETTTASMTSCPPWAVEKNLEYMDVLDRLLEQASSALSDQGENEKAPLQS